MEAREQSYRITCLKPSLIKLPCDHEGWMQCSVASEKGYKKFGLNDKRDDAPSTELCTFECRKKCKNGHICKQICKATKNCGHTCDQKVTK